MKGEFEFNPEANKEKNTNAVAPTLIEKKMNISIKRENASLPEKGDKKKDESITVHLLICFFLPDLISSENREREWAFD